MGVSHIVAKKGVSILGGRGRFWEGRIDICLKGEGYIQRRKSF